jgi:hypothetical protein
MGSEPAWVFDMLEAGSGMKVWVAVREGVVGTLSMSVLVATFASGDRSLR